MQKAGIPIRRYAYDAVNHMVSGKNLENGEKTSYTYNALGMRTNLIQTLLGKDAFKTREVSYLPDYLSGTANDLVAYEQGQVLRYAERNIWGDLKLPIHNDLNISGIQDSLRFTSYAYDPVIGKYFAQARFYDSRQGRMLSKDPVKRDINGYPYCNNDPVNCVDPTGEIANVLIGGAIGGLVGGAFGFANSAVSQLMSGKGFDSGKAWGAAANGAIVGAVKGAVAGSGVGLPLAIAADFTAGTLGSVAEQAISEGVVDAGKSIAGGLTNAVNGLIYGNGALRSLREAAVKGAASGALTSGINYLADVTGPQPAARRSPGIQYQGGAAGMFRPRDPKKECVPSDPSIGSLRYGRDYGYQYNVPVSGEESQNRRGFSLCDFMKEMLTGAVTGGMAGATFYGAGRAVSALKESIKGGSNRYINGQRTSKFHELTEDEIVSLKNDIKEIGADESVFRFNEGYQTGYSDKKGLIYVKGDVLPDLNSTHPRDLMSPKAVLAHEYYGHKYFGDLYGRRNPTPGAWNDEFRASYSAALNTPNLGELDRMYLMLDALDRAKEAGVNIKITDIIRRILYGY